MPVARLCLWSRLAQMGFVSVVVCGVRSSAGYRSSAGIVGWRISYRHFRGTTTAAHVYIYIHTSIVFVARWDCTLYKRQLLVNMQHAPHTVRNPPPVIQVVKKQRSTSRERTRPSRHLRGAASAQRRAGVGEGHGQLLGRFKFSRQVYYSIKCENTRA